MMLLEARAFVLCDGPSHTYPTPWSQMEVSSADSPATLAATGARALLNQGLSDLPKVREGACVTELGISL